MSLVSNNRLLLSSQLHNGPILPSVSEGLQTYFRKYGDLKKCFVVRDWSTKQSR